MDDIIEFLLELILDGMVEVAGSKRVPLPIRILLFSLLAIVVLGMFALMLWIGIENESIVMIVLSVALLIAFIIGICLKIRKHCNKKVTG